MSTSAATPSTPPSNVTDPERHRLERAGYARRVGDPKDRRRVLVELTPLARERAEAIWGPYSFFREMLGRYTVEQLELLRDFHRMGREYNERRAAEVRGLRFEDQSGRSK